MNSGTYRSGLLQVKSYKILQGRVAATLEAFNLSASEWSIIGIVSEHKNGLNLASIADVLGVEPPLVTILIEGLVRKNLVKKADHPIDKRVKLIFITPKSKNLIPEIEQSLKGVLNELLSGLSIDDLQAYKKVLETIVKNNNS
jgi:MarR family transcriptional regulator for hemolysin